MRFRSETAPAILEALADQAEQEGRQRVCRVRLSADRHHAYFDDTSAAERTAAHEDLDQLEAGGIVAIGWQRWERGNWLAHVDLADGAREGLFEILGRRPKSERMAQLVALLGTVADPVPWVKACLDWAAARVSRGQKPLPLDWDAPGEARDVLIALAALAKLPEATLERVLSTRVFGDSKRFEAIRPKVVRLLAQFWPGADAVEDSDLLRAIGVDRAPEYVPVAGPIVIDRTLDLAGVPFSVALPAPVLRTAAFGHSGAAAVVTIENETSFAQWLEVRPPDIIAVLTGGFPSRAVLRLVRDLARLGLPVFHWGDLDAGGLEILAYLRREVGPVTALAMGAKELEAFRDACRPLPDGDRRRLERVRERPELADSRSAIDHLLQAGRKLEQEIVPPIRVADDLARGLLRGEAAPPVA